jgi:N-methylhydantoinase B
MRGGAGGGLGDPLLRDPSAVARDIADGHITVEHARAAYGAILTEDGVIDEDASAQLRNEIRRQRIGGSPEKEQRPPRDAGIALERTAEGWACASCAANLAPSETNWRDGAVSRSTPAAERLAELGMYTASRRSGPPIMLTEHFCPACAAAIGTDHHLAGAGPAPAALREVRQKTAEPAAALSQA